MDICIRLENKEDHRIVEEMTREAFWNLHIPGCDEHLLAHKLRDCAAFIPKLNFVALSNGHVVGNIMYCHAAVKRDDGAEVSVLTFGPVSVWPKYQKQGIGSALIRHSLQKALELGYVAVLIYGDPAYYYRFGFEPAQKFGISTSQGGFLDALMALELAPGALDGACGRFFEGEAYYVDAEALEEFEKTFPHKEKRVTESQKRFAEMSSQMMDSDSTLCSIDSE